MSIAERVPVVAGLAYIERVRRLQPAMTVTLSVEPDNRYFRHAIAVLAGDGKVGYIAPEIACRYYETIKAAPAPVTCPARRASASDHETSGVELLLDLTAVALTDSD